MLGRIENALGSGWIGPVCLGLLLGILDVPWWAAILLMVIYVNAFAQIEAAIEKSGKR